MAQVARGFRQGGVLSPLMEELLRLVDHNGHKTLGYADYLQQVQNVITRLSEEEGLNMSIQIDHRGIHQEDQTRDALTSKTAFN